MEAEDLEVTKGQQDKAQQKLWLRLGCSIADVSPEVSCNLTGVQEYVDTVLGRTASANKYQHKSL